MAVKESLEIGLTGLCEKGYAVVEGWNGQRDGVSQFLRLRPAAPAHSKTGVDIAKAFGGDDIFAAIDTGAHDIVDAHRQRGQKAALVPQPRFDPKSAVVIDRIVRVEVLQPGIAE